jgi:hypothetical protein
MPIRTKKSEKKTNQSDWKNLIHGFVGNVLDQMSDNVSKKIQIWIKILKRKTIGSVLMILGVMYLFVGMSIFLNSILNPLFPGLGYMTIGVLAALVGFLVGNNESK